MRREGSSKTSTGLLLALAAILLVPGVNASDESCNPIPSAHLGQPEVGGEPTGFALWEMCRDGIRAQWTDRAPSAVRLDFGGDVVLEESPKNLVINITRDELRKKAELARRDFGEPMTVGVWYVLSGSPEDKNGPVHVGLISFQLSAEVPGKAAADPGSATVFGVELPIWAWIVWLVILVLAVALVAWAVVMWRSARRRDGAARNRAPLSAAPVPDVAVRVVLAPQGGQPLLHGERLFLSYKGSPIRATGRGNEFEFSLSRQEASELQVGHFTLASKHHQLVPGGSRIEWSGDHPTARLAVRELSYPVQVFVQDVSQGVGISGVRVRMSFPDQPERVPMHAMTDANGLAACLLPLARVKAEIAAVDSLVMDAKESVFVPRHDSTTKVTLNVRVADLPDLGVDVHVRGPPGNGELALSGFGSGVAKEYLRVLREAYRSPELHARNGGNVVRTFSKGVAGVVREAVVKEFEGIFAEKQVQAHVLGLPSTRWSGTFRWSRKPDEVVALLSGTDARGRLADASLVGTVRAKRQRVESRLSERARDLVLRPCVRILEVADGLLLSAAEDPSAYDVLAADVLIEAAEQFLTDPDLGREWSKS